MANRRRRLGELVLRSANTKELVDFYVRVIGLEPYATVGSATFLKVADDFEGHPQMLAIFEKTHEFSGPRDSRSEAADSGAGTLHHFAFALDRVDFLSERDRLEKMGIELHTAEHAQFGWRSIYTYDPDGNSVELVCYDESILDKAANKRVRQGSS